MGQEELIEKLEDFIVPYVNKPAIEYLHGDCHIFAIALHEELGFDIEFLFDEEHWFDDKPDPERVLIHAYTKGKEGYVDIRGIISVDEIEQPFDYNVPFREAMSLKEVYDLMESGFIHKPEPEELNLLKKFLQVHGKELLSGNLYSTM